MKILGYNIIKAQNIIDKINHLSKNEFMNWQDQKKWSIVKYHFNENAFYRKKLVKIFHPNGKTYQ